jgi:1,2-diacylglycerol 3-alpha-glucosyltransferase
MSEAAPLRVAIFGESYFPYLSGVTVSTDALARGLSAAGHDVLLLVPAPNGRRSFRDRDGSAGDDGPAIAWLPSLQGPPPVPPGYRVPRPVPSAALRQARAFGPNVVHAQSPFISGLMARRVARAAGAPLIFTHHTRFGDYGHYLGPLAAPGRALMRAYIRRFWRGCAAIVAPGSELAAEIEAILEGDGRRPSHPCLPIVRVIPTGIDVAAIAALPEGHPRREAGWRPGVDFVVTSLGRLAPEKGVDILLDAFAIAAAERPELRFLLIGSGPLEPAVRARANHDDLRGRLHVMGQRPRPEALGLLKACDLFAFASSTETQGLVLAEALAAGVPVVTLEGPGVRDSVRDGTDGVIVPREPGSTASERLGKAIGALAADPERRRAMATAARQGAERFALERRIAEVVELYREAIARG